MGSFIVKELWHSVTFVQLPIILQNHVCQGNLQLTAGEESSRARMVSVSYNEIVSKQPGLCLV